MRDYNGVSITPNTTLRRVVEGRSAQVGHKYTVILQDFNGTGKEEMVADGGFIKELLTPERAKEFEVIE